jgi:thiol-disulfide isomerase/thioredoxin
MTVMRTRLGLILGSIALATGAVATFAGMNQNNYTASANPVIAQAQTGTRLAQELQGKPVVVKIHADWCRACKTIAPIIKEMQQQYNGRANFVVFDITNQSTIKASVARAKELGLDGFFDKNKTRNATVAFINPEDGQVLDEFTKNTNRADYIKAIDSAINKVRN